MSKSKSKSFCVNENKFVIFYDQNTLKESYFLFGQLKKRFETVLLLKENMDYAKKNYNVGDIYISLIIDSSLLNERSKNIFCKDYYRIKAEDKNKCLVSITAGDNANLLNGCYALLNQFGYRWVMKEDYGMVYNKSQKYIDYPKSTETSEHFEIRSYWISTHGTEEGHDVLRKANGYNIFKEKKTLMPKGLDKYILKEDKLSTERKFQVPEDQIRNINLEDENVISNFVDVISKEYVDNDGSFISFGLSFPTARENVDKNSYKLKIDNIYIDFPSMSDRFLAFYNQVAKLLEEKFPHVNTKIMFRAYTDCFYPPQTNIKAHKNIYLMFINIENAFHVPYARSFDKYKKGIFTSELKKQFIHCLKKWTEVMDGRVIVHDYNQSGICWRDLINVGAKAFLQDIKIYKDLNIIGVYTESKGNDAVVFFDRYLRGRIFEQPDMTENEFKYLLKNTLTDFYSPYIEYVKIWEWLYNLWDNTTEDKEYFTITATYTPKVVEKLKSDLKKINKKYDLSKIECDALRERIRITNLSFELLIAYCESLYEANDLRYNESLESINKAFELREKLSSNKNAMTPFELIHAIYKKQNRFYIWPGEISEVKNISETVCKSIRQTLIKDWSFEESKDQTGLILGNTSSSYYEKNKSNMETMYPFNYMRGYRTPNTYTYDFYPHKNFYFYSTVQNIDLSFVDNGHKYKLIFPGIMNNNYLYINDFLHDVLNIDPIWWMEKQRSNLIWEVDITKPITEMKHKNVKNLNICVYQRCSLEYPGFHKTPFLVITND